MKPRLGYSGKGRNKRIPTAAQLKAKRTSEVISFLYEKYKMETSEDVKAELLNSIREIRSSK